MTKFRNKYRAESTRAQWWDYGDNADYFVTINTKNRFFFFGEIRDKKMKLSEIGELAFKFWQEIPEHFPFAKLGEFIVMPNHVHGIITIDKPNAEKPQIRKELPGKKRFQNQGKNTLSSILGSYKSVVSRNARKINPKFGWQRLFHDEIIFGKTAHDNISRYIRNNPKKWKGT